MKKILIFLGLRKSKKPERVTYGTIHPKGIVRTIVPQEFLQNCKSWEGSEHPEKFPNQIIV